MRDVGLLGMEREGGEESDDGREKRDKLKNKKCVIKKLFFNP